MFKIQSNSRESPWVMGWSSFLILVVIIGLEKCQSVRDQHGHIDVLFLTLHNNYIRWVVPEKRGEEHV